MKKVALVSVSCFMLIGLALLVWNINNQKLNSDQKEPSKSYGRDSSLKNRELSRFSFLIDIELTWQERVGRIRGVDTPQLSGEDLTMLYDVLHHVPINSDREGWFVIVNEIMEQLRACGVDSQKYFDTLLDIAENSKVDEVIRDYAIQHLAHSFNSENQNVEGGIGTDPQKISAFSQSLVSLIQDPSLSHSSLSGT